MNIVKLTGENIHYLEYPGVMKPAAAVRKPVFPDSTDIDFLTRHIEKDIQGFIAIDADKPAGHILVAHLDRAAVPLRSSRPDIPVILSLVTVKKYRRQGIAEDLIRRVIEDNQEAPGILTLPADSRTMKEHRSFRRMGFKKIAEHGLLKAEYRPGTKKMIDAAFYTPGLERDYVRPFTFVTDPFRPGMRQVMERQKRILNAFPDMLPPDEIPYEEARARNPEITPGLYLFGKMPETGGFVTGLRLKRIIKKTIREEARKTFGAASPTRYTKRK